MTLEDFRFYHYWRNIGWVSLLSLPCLYPRPDGPDADLRLLCLLPSFISQGTPLETMVKSQHFFSSLRLASLVCPLRLLIPYLFLPRPSSPLLLTSQVDVRPQPLCRRPPRRRSLRSPRPREGDHPRARVCNRHGSKRSGTTRIPDLGRQALPGRVQGAVLHGCFVSHL